MSLSNSPCDKHELTNCAECTGAAARHAETLIDSRWSGDVLPLVAGFTVIASQFPGTCGQCSRWYPEGSVICRERGQDSIGWIGYDCCVARS